MSYEAMQKTEKIFRGAQFWVFDESHALANPQSLRSKAAMAYARSYHPQKILLMSGTPIRSKIPNLYPALRILDEINNNGFNARFKTARSFCIEYTHEEIKKINGFLVTEYVGAKNVEELKQWLRPVYFKNKLSDVADIPSLSFVDITLDVSDKKAETQLQKEWDNYIKGGFAKPEDYGDGMVGEHISTAKASSALHKSDEVARFAIDLIESESYKKLVIFTDHRASAKNIAAKLRVSKISVRLIMGGTSDKDRDEAVQSFQNGGVGVIIGTIGAMSAGLTLTAAHCALFCDLSWTPAQNAQAYGRIHRISQKEKCIIYRFSTAGVDEAITRNIVEKTKTINAVFGEQA
jgi:SNF2 family DNA or RNA helicase